MKNLVQRHFNEPYFVKHAKTLVNEDGERVYSGPETGNWWINIEVSDFTDYTNNICYLTLYCIDAQQSKLQRDCRNDKALVLALMLYSDATQLSSNGKRSAWPIMMSLANLPPDVRGARGGFKLIGIIPDVKNVRLSATENAFIFQKCLSTLLAPLKQLSNEGFSFGEHNLFPLLYAYVHDYPEGSKVSIHFIYCKK